jgi:glycerophosphoryl diester phosphodiesterase
MDGSAGPFVFLLQSAGIEEQNAPKKFIRILRPVEIRDGDKWVRFEPHNGFKLDLSIDFNHPVFDRSSQSVSVDFSTTSYIKEVSRARTFGFMHDASVERTTNGRGAVSKLTIEQLQRLDAGDGRPVPTLDEVFEIFGPTLLYNVELKTGIWSDSNLAAAVAERIDGHHLEEHVLVSSFNPIVVQQARKTLNPRTPAAHLRMTGLSALKHRFVKSEGDNPYFKLVDDRYMNWARRENLLVNVWTVDDPVEAQRLAQLGVTSIITNIPSLIQSEIGS